jgi:hypothetical protein
MKAEKISPSQLIGDALYQVNLLLWMLQPSTGAVVNPLLQKAGYKLVQIEPEFRLPVELVNQLQTDSIFTRDPVCPDLLINSPTNDYVILECKKKMFGSQPQPGMSDGQIRQARSLLLYIPQFLASALSLQPKDVTSTHLLYLSQHEPPISQTQGLKELATDLTTKAYKTISFGLLGLSVEGNAVAMRGNYSPGVLPSSLMRQLGKNDLTVHEIIDDKTDPRPLYYLPWMPDSAADNDTYSQQAFANRILASAVTVIGPAKPPCEIALDVEQLLLSATSNLYDRWRNRDIRKRLRDRTKELIKKTLRQSSPDLELISLELPARGWKFEIIDQKIQSRIIEGLRKGEQRDWNMPVSRGLFDDVDGTES